VVTTFNATKRIEFFTNPKSLKLDSENLTMISKTVSEGYEVIVSTTTLQKDVFLYAQVSGHFEDNFFNLEAGESRTIFFKTSSAREPAIQFKTLNKMR
jgi:beta-mannosidase